MPKLALLKTARELAKGHDYDGPALREAIPYLEEFNGKVFVLKVGGSILNDVSQIPELVADIVFLKKVGIKTILVHGGAKQLDAKMKEKNLPVKKVNGLRVTSVELLDVANEVFLGISHRVKQEIEKSGFKSVVLDKSTGLVRSKQADPQLQCVGIPVSVNTDLLNALEADVIPVIPAITASADENFPGFNVNADDVASWVARELGVEKLILMSDVEGVKNAQGDLIPSLTSEEVYALIDKGVIAGGMIPKVKSCLNALEGGVHKAHIILGNNNAFMDEILTDQGTGTEFVNKK